MKKRGHVGMWLDVDGEPVHVLADPNMSEETAAAIAKIVRAVREMPLADLDAIERKHYVSTRYVTMRPPKDEDVQVNAARQDVIDRLKAAGYTLVEGDEP